MIDIGSVGKASVEAETGGAEQTKRGSLSWRETKTAGHRVL